MALNKSMSMFYVFHGIVDKGKIAVNQVFVGEGVICKSCLLNLLKSFQETHEITATSLEFLPLMAGYIFWVNLFQI